MMCESKKRGTTTHVGIPLLIMLKNVRQRYYKFLKYARKIDKNLLKSKKMSNFNEDIKMCESVM